MVVSEDSALMVADRSCEDSGVAEPEDTEFDDAELDAIASVPVEGSPMVRVNICVGWSFFVEISTRPPVVKKLMRNIRNLASYDTNLAP